ncbi:glutaminyl-peptide cyclotransferase [Moraxella nasovis]|uniref:glutaminyl-peptide cyclotransferase n=1 Tax=Moraxella nasovis TaxID=2904121 RepID=UPI001F6078E5|nr:glutaminyl-peptide cyclotransferase [Moraxella nasovis]UNU72639.1 glutaminyl-peptide cyclotransferase [Moraxella nasovis]
MNDSIMITRFLSIAALVFGLSVGTAYAQHNITLIKQYASDNTAFTQGLERLDDDRLLLATGRYGKSSIGVFNLRTGKYTIKAHLPKQYFGEGASVTPYGIWQLTWKEHTAFLRDAQDFHIIAKAHYDSEGWGLAYYKDQDILYMSDGTDVIQLRDAKTFKLIGNLPIRYQNKAVHLINELEFANGFIYANVWQSNFIIKIDPATGDVVKLYDATQLLNTTFTKAQRQHMDVLNGIAHIKDNRFYITGKLYPNIFEVVLD